MRARQYSSHVYTWLLQSAELQEEEEEEEKEEEEEEEEEEER